VHHEFLRVLAEPVCRFAPLPVSRVTIQKLARGRESVPAQAARVLPGTQNQARPDLPVHLLWLSRWFNWRGALTVVTLRTFIGWHRQGFRFYWRRKCQAGRPPIPLELQALIRTVAHENPSWGEERIANELLLKLGLRVSPRTIRKYLPKPPAAPGGHRRHDQRWSTFLKNHAAAIIACDFCVVASATFRLLYVLVSWNTRRAELFTLT
jgi:putative transposase